MLILERKRRSQQQQAKISSIKGVRPPHMAVIFGQKRQTNIAWDNMGCECECCYWCGWGVAQLLR